MVDSHESYSQLKTRSLMFERYALALLQAQAIAEGRILLTGNELSREFAFADAVAPLGLFELPGPVLVEIRVTFNERRFLEFLERLRSSAVEPASLLL